jgi:hypothetical protein
MTDHVDMLLGIDILVFAKLENRPHSIAETLVICKALQSLSLPNLYQFWSRIPLEADGLALLVQNASKHGLSPAAGLGYPSAGTGSVDVLRKPSV